MATPATFIGSGTVPQSTDSMRMLWVKKLATIQGSLPSPNARNNPSRNDTIRRLKFKADRAANGL